MQISRAEMSDEAGKQRPRGKRGDTYRLRTEGAGWHSNCDRLGEAGSHVIPKSGCMTIL